MIGAFHRLAHPGVDLVVLLHVLAGRHLLAAEAVEGGLGDDLAREAQAAAEALAVLLAIKVVEEDVGLFEGVGRPQADMAPAFRLVRAGQHHEAVALQGLLAVIAHGGGQEVELDVGRAERGVRADEAAAFEMVRDREAALEQHPFGADQEAAEEAHLAVQGDGFLAGILDIDLGMVLQVLAHARQIMQDFDARLLQHRPRPDARALQQVRRGDGTGGDQHLAPGLGHLALALMVVFYPHGALALQQDAPGHGMGDHGQVRAAHRGFQIGICRRPAHAVLHRHVHRAEALLHEAIGIIGADVARFLPGLDEGAVERVLHLVPGIGRQRSLGPAIAVAAALPAFGALEIGQAVGIAPVARAQGFPFVEIAGMAAHVDQPVDRGRPAQDLAARAMHLAAIQPRLRLGHVFPVVLGAVHRDRQRCRHLDEDRLVAAAIFQHQHAGCRVLAEAVGQNAAGGTGTDDDVVEVPGHEGSSLRRVKERVAGIEGPPPKGAAGRVSRGGSRPSRRPWRRSGSGHSGPARPPGRTAARR